MSQYGAFPYNQLKLPLGGYPAHYFSEGLCSLLDMAFCLRDQKSIFIPLNQVDTRDFKNWERGGLENVWTESGAGASTAF